MAGVATKTDFTTVYPSGETNTAIGSSTPNLADRLDRLEASADALETAVGTEDVTDAASLDSRVTVLEEIGGGVNATAYGISASNSAAVNGPALQTLIDDLGAFGGQPIYFPPGVYDLPNGMLNHEPSTILKGVSNTNTILRNRGTGAGSAFWTIGGTVDSFAGRTYNSGFENIGLENYATSGADSQQIAILLLHATHHYYTRVRFRDFRAGAVLASDFADSYIDECEFEWCGSKNNTDTPVIHLTGLLATAWAADEIRITNCRFEHNGERIFAAIPGNGNLVSKIRFDGCKFENVKSDGDGIAGDGTTGTQFFLQNTDGVQFNDCDFTYSNLRTGYAGPVPSMIHLEDTNCTSFSNIFIPVGDSGASDPTFDTFFLCDGDNASSFSNVLMTGGNGNAYPSAEWTFTGGGGENFTRHGCTWGYQGGGAPPGADSGSPAGAGNWS